MRLFLLIRSIIDRITSGSTNTNVTCEAICVITGLYPKIGIVRPITAEIPVRILKGFVLVLSELHGCCHHVLVV